MQATREDIKNNAHWIFKCDCEHTIMWGAHLDEHFWSTRSKQHSWCVRTCKCQTKYLLNPIDNEVTEVA